MNEPLREVPRFIPTLTEVVDPTTLGTPAHVSQRDERALIDEVQRQLRPLLEQRLQEETERLINTLVTPSMDDLARRLHGELDGMIRQTLSRCLDARKP